MGVSDVIARDPELIRQRAEALHAEAIRIAELNDRERNPLFTPAPVCLSTFEAAVIASDLLWLLGDRPTKLAAWSCGTCGETFDEKPGPPHPFCQSKAGTR